MKAGKRNWPMWVLCVCLIAFLLGACGGQGASENEEADEPEAVALDVSSELDQLYVNEEFMLEMLINDDCIVTQDGSLLGIESAAGNALMTISLFPGIQNLSAAGEVARYLVANSFEDVTISELSDGNLFGARAKTLTYDAGTGEDSMSGVEGAAVVNQSLYVLNVIFMEAVTDNEGDLMLNLMDSINIVRPAQVDSEAKTAVYETHYPEAQPAPQSRNTVTEWEYLPYYYYSWWDSADGYGDYPEWYFEPDWDYYSDPGDYWDWGWDDDSDWWFYDEYGDYYDYDYYQDYDDYWGSYDPWSDPGDYYDSDYYDSDSYGSYYDSSDGYDYDSGSYDYDSSSYYSSSSY